MFRDDLTVLLSYKVRSLTKETPFWSAFGLWFTFEPVLAKRKAFAEEEPDSSWRCFGSSSSEDSFVFVAHRRAESFSWIVPPTDQDLLDGVGAWGTKSRKGDDTFEILLLMMLDEDGT